MPPALSLEYLWEITNFRPNHPQTDAIQHTAGPLYLTAGPGSGKTRVLLWRTLNLIVFHNISPSRIFLATFTEKAALQLREGLQSLLGIVTNHTGVNYDLGEMYIGTIHSQCLRLITDREIQPGRQRVRPPRLLDALAQYFHLANYRNWIALIEGASLDLDTANETINGAFGIGSSSKHNAVTSCISFFNRLAEEQIDPTQAMAQLDSDETIHTYFTEQGINLGAVATLLSLARVYQNLLDEQNCTTFSLLQQVALDTLANAPGDRFDHIIIDEYQDTNTIQERIVFSLAGSHSNICVVGDDDQSLYRFRGATVENFVEFPQRCQTYLGVEPRRITLNRNYRSREPIVDFYTDFIDRCDWRKDGTDEHFRVMDKNIIAHRACETPAVVATQSAPADAVFDEIAELVRDLIERGIVTDPNQVAFLFPSLQYRGDMNIQVERMKNALEAVGLEVYAPRAGRFLEVQEAIDIFGVFAHIMGTPPRNGEIRGRDYDTFRDWLDLIQERGQELIDADPNLAAYVQERRNEIQGVLATKMHSSPSCSASAGMYGSLMTSTK